MSRVIKSIESRGREAVPLEMNGQKVNSFIQPVTENDTPKLYVVKSESEVIYVGKALQSIERRLTQGLKAKGEHGYHGYKWKHLSEVDILIWCFTKESHVRIEAIEAELVYLIQKNTGKWPKYQMEFHFHDTSDAESQIAEAIFKELYRYMC